MAGSVAAMHAHGTAANASMKALVKHLALEGAVRTQRVAQVMCQVDRGAFINPAYAHPIEAYEVCACGSVVVADAQIPRWHLWCGPGTLIHNLVDASACHMLTCGLCARLGMHSNPSMRLSAIILWMCHVQLRSEVSFPFAASCRHSLHVPMPTYTCVFA